MSATITSIDPTTGETVERYELDAPAAVDAALARAVVAQRRVVSADADVRAALLRAVARELRAAAEPLAQTMALEMGKVLAEGRAEVEKSATCCEYYAEHGAAHLAPQAVETGAAESYVQFPPLGVVLAIMPWNYPVWQVIRAAAPAWMAGNAVVLKHASNVTGCALLLRDVVARAAGDAAPLEVLLMAGRDVADVIADDRIAAVTLTGSEGAGIAVATACARHLKRSVLELGGSDAFVVLADADVEAAARAAAAARFLNAGQSCIAAKRFVVAHPLVEEFSAAFVRHTEALRVGDPRDEGVQLGPMARVDLRDEIADQVDRGLRAGGVLLTGGTSPDGPGAFYAPTIVSGVTRDNPLAREETFGPVAAVLTAADDEQAIAVANDSPYGLSSSVWTADPERAKALASRIEAGAVFVNAPSASDTRMPFGGVKRSGWGRELGAYGIKEFVNVQAVTVAS